MKNIFINPNDQRFRAGWRIFFFLVVFWILASFTFVIKPLFGDITKREFLQHYSLFIVAILTVSATIAVYVARKKWDKKSVVSLGLKRNSTSVKDIFFGFILSGLMAGLFFLLLMVFGLIEYQGLAIHSQNVMIGSSGGFAQFMTVVSIGSMSLLLLEHVMVGYWEELFFRGYLLQNMMEGIGYKVAIAVSCILYGLIHAANPNAGIMSTLIIVLFGFLRIYGWLSTKMLWLSIGMHIGWNFFQGPIFGFAASGHQKATLIELEIISTDSWLTGGDFGPEGSVLIIPILILALLAMRWYSKSRLRNGAHGYIKAEGVVV